MSTASNQLSEPPAALQRRLRTLGHGLYRLSEAWRLLHRRLDKGLLDEPTTAWIRRWCGEDLARPLPLPVDAGLRAVLEWSGKTWQVTGMAEKAGEGPIITAPWAAALVLLRLPALKAFWIKALRFQRFRWLTQVLPHVWVLDDQPLRPGAVIAGVCIASWNELPRLLANGRAFELLPPGGEAPQPVAATTWSGTLASFNGSRPRLREIFTLPVEGRLSATWKHDEKGRIVLNGG